MIRIKNLICPLPFLVLIYIVLYLLYPSFISKPFQKCARTKRSSLLIGVISDPKQFDRRTFIRATWGNRSYYGDILVHIAFVMGITIGNMSKDTQKKIEKENSYFHDIIQGDYIESYRNLTLKTMALLEWMSHNSPNTSFLLKVDDDVFVHPYKLTQMVKVAENSCIKNTILCKVHVKAKVIRDGTYRYSVSESEFKNLEFYPPYCSGPAYMITGDLVPKLYKSSFDVAHFWLEDVYTTGLLAKEIGAKHLNLPQLWSTIDTISYEFTKWLFVNGVVVFLHTNHAHIDIDKWNVWNDILEKRKRKLHISSLSSDILKIYMNLKL